jgi:hypothetical protein
MFMPRRQANMHFTTHTTCMMEMIVEAERRLGS